MLCLPPLVTMISSSAKSRLLSRLNLRCTASFSARVPSCGGYLVSPSRAARYAASMACGGVGKSGSPLARLMTFTPLAANSRPFIAMTTEAETWKSSQALGEGRHQRSPAQNRWMRPQASVSTASEVA